MYLLPNIVVADDHCYPSDTTTTQRAHTKHDTPNDKRQIATNDDATSWKRNPNLNITLPINQTTYLCTQNGERRRTGRTAELLADVRLAQRDGRGGV